MEDISKKTLLRAETVITPIPGINGSPGRREAADWHSGASRCYNSQSWGNGGITMLRYRLALVVAGTLSLTAPSAWAFSLQNAGSGGDGNSSFTDPADRLRTVSPKASDGSIRASSRHSSVSSSKVHLIPFGGSNRYTATALIISRSVAATERASFSAVAR
jgi:hypothetical protein